MQKSEKIHPTTLFYESPSSLRKSEPIKQKVRERQVEERQTFSFMGG
jgi:hypothetical protein